MTVVPIAGVLCTDASVGPRSAAAGIVFKLFNPNAALNIEIFSAESIPVGLTIPESEALAIKRGYTLLRQVFNAHPLKLQLMSLLILTDNQTVANLFTKRVRTKSLLLPVIRDEIMRDFVGPALYVEHITANNTGHRYAGLLKEAHMLARCYKRNIGALLND